MQQGPVGKVVGWGLSHGAIVFIFTGLSWLWSNLRPISVPFKQAALKLINASPVPLPPFLLGLGAITMGSIMIHAILVEKNQESAQFENRSLLEKAINIGAGWVLPFAGYFLFSLSPFQAAAFAAIAGAVTREETLAFVKQAYDVISLYAEPYVAPYLVPVRSFFSRMKDSIFKSPQPDQKDKPIVVDKTKEIPANAALQEPVPALVPTTIEAMPTATVVDDANSADEQGPSKKPRIAKF